MLKQKVCHDNIHKDRLLQVVKAFPNAVLVPRNTSGKTYTLVISAPGPYPVQRTIVRMHRRDHKAFWAAVKLAQTWLDAARLLYAPAPLLLSATVGSTASVQVDISDTITARTDSQKLVAAAANIPVLAQTPMVAAAAKPRRDTLWGYEGKKKGASKTANKYYHGRDIYTASLHEMMAQLDAERGLA